MLIYHDIKCNQKETYYQIHFRSHLRSNKSTHIVFWSDSKSLKADINVSAWWRLPITYTFWKKFLLGRGWKIQRLRINDNLRLCWSKGCLNFRNKGSLYEGKRFLIGKRIKWSDTTLMIRNIGNYMHWDKR